MRLVAVSRIISHFGDMPPRKRFLERTLILAGMAIWILNGLHGNPDDLLHDLCRQASPRVLRDPNADPFDLEVPTQPLMYDAGIYFLCDVVWDTDQEVYHIPDPKRYKLDTLTHLFGRAIMNEVYGPPSTL